VARRDRVTNFAWPKLGTGHATSIRPFVRPLVSSSLRRTMGSGTDPSRAFWSPLPLFQPPLKIVALGNLALLCEARRQIMGNYANLAPGSTVPVSGNYRCFFCGEGGIADFMATALGDLPVGGPQLRSQANQKTVRYFQQ
jgi:hypothetical protein